MQRYKILSKLLATALLIQGTASYATAASSNNTIIDDIGCTVATGSAITEQILKPEFEQEQDKTQLKSSVIPKKALRKAGQTGSIYDNKTYTHANALME